MTATTTFYGGDENDLPIYPKLLSVSYNLV